MRNLKQKEVCLTLCVAKDRIIPDILHHTGAVVHSYHSQCLFHCLKEIDLKSVFLESSCYHSHRSCSPLSWLPKTFLRLCPMSGVSPLSVIICQFAVFRCLQHLRLSHSDATHLQPFRSLSGRFNKGQSVFCSTQTSRQAWLSSNLFLKIDRDCSDGW